MIHLRPLISSACLFFKALVAFFADTKQTTRNEKGLPYLHIWGIWHGVLCSLIVFFLLSVPESTAQSYRQERPPSTNKIEGALFDTLSFYVYVCSRATLPAPVKVFSICRKCVVTNLDAFGSQEHLPTLLILTWSQLLSHLGTTQVPLPSRLWRLNLISAWAKNRIRLWFFSLFVAHSQLISMGNS